LSVVAGRRELCRLRNEIAAAEFEWPKDCRGFNMSRSVLAVSAALLAAALPTHANAQTGTHNCSGLCAFYPAHGNGLTAAHRTLPFGTRVRVTDPKTGRTVTVTVNDRGPFGRHRVLDLSPSAARALGMMSRGVIFVQAEVL
jgi:phosphatidate phosphatase APP1